MIVKILIILLMALIIIRFRIKSPVAVTKYRNVSLI